MTEVVTLTAPGSAARWVGPAAGVAVGLAAASSVCSLLARLRQDPSLALVTDRPDVASVLSRSTVVGAAMLVVFTVYALLTWRRTDDGADDRAQRRTTLLRHLAPAMAVTGLLGLWWRIMDPTAELFKDARTQQASLAGADVAGLASIAWICACLAVLVLAAVAGVGGPRRGSLYRRGRALVPATAALTAMAVAGVSVLTLGNPVAHQVAAEPAAVSAVNIGGPIAYYIPIGLDSDAFLSAAGPGVLAGAGGGVRALSGATGEQVWSLSYPDLNIYGAAAPASDNGDGSGGVAVLAATYRGVPVLIGLDAATGTPLWTRPDAGTLTVRGVNTPQLSTQRFLTIRSIRPSPTSARTQWEWTVRELRTGERLWSFTTDPDCAYPPTLTESFVLSPRCGEAKGIDVLDGQTGAKRTTLNATDLWPEMDHSVKLFTWPLPGTDQAAVSATSGVYRAVRPTVVLDTATGDITRHLPASTGFTAVDSQTITLRDPQGRDVIVDLDSEATIETGLSTDNLKYNNNLFGTVWARVGNQWVTLTPTPGQAPALHVFNHEEPMKTYPNPCAGENVPTVRSVTGALLINCGDRVVAVR